MPFDLEQAGAALALVVVAAVSCAALILLLRPLLIRYASARPNARSLHRSPTPQGGGVAVVIAALTVALAGAALIGLQAADWRRLATVAFAAIGLAAIGGLDDIRPLPAAPRLVLQIALSVLAVAALPTDLRLIGAAPFTVERAVLAVGLAWFVNLTNFMDGMDWMTVAETVPIAAAMVAFAALGVLPATTGLIALALLGAIIGFAPFNAPVARLFLGDVGSLPIGLLVGFCLIELALRGDFSAALLLPLYYIVDSGLTLLRRLARGAAVWKPHREHFYQRAAAGGLTAGECVLRVFGVNLILVLLAVLSHFVSGVLASAALVLGGLAAVAILLRGFAHGRREGGPHYEGKRRRPGADLGDLGK